MRKTLIATTKVGLEKIVREELNLLGFEQTTHSLGRVEFEAAMADIPRANLWLRCADRVLLKMAEFKAFSFDELFESTKALPWEELITPDGKFTIKANAARSTLVSNRSCQSIVKKAVVERLKEKFDIEWFEETGAEFTIHVNIYHDIVVLAVDTSGTGLHKRGYRQEGGDAPLKETFAAALVKLTPWNKGRILIDPMCGSGTMLIEAAMMARNMAPGLNREFASEQWPSLDPAAWEQAKAEARHAVDLDSPLQLFGYDIDKSAIEICRANAENAGVAADIHFEQKDIKDLWIDRQQGVIVSNPPYGIRLTQFQDLTRIYVTMNKTFRKKLGWSVNILTADKKFPDYFKRAAPDRIEEFLNGTIKVNFYQYAGDLSSD